MPPLAAGLLFVSFGTTSSRHTNTQHHCDHWLFLPCVTIEQVLCTLELVAFFPCGAFGFCVLWRKSEASKLSAKKEAESKNTTESSQKVVKRGTKVMHHNKNHQKEKAEQSGQSNQTTTRSTTRWKGTLPLTNKTEKPSLHLTHSLATRFILSRLNFLSPSSSTISLSISHFSNNHCLPFTSFPFSVPLHPLYLCTAIAHSTTFLSPLTLFVRTISLSLPPQPILISGPYMTLQLSCSLNFRGNFMVSSPLWIDFLPL